MSVGSLRCPQCQKEILLRFPDAVAVRCEACHSLIERHSLRVIELRNRRGKAVSGLSLGMKGRILDTDVEIVGWIKYQGRDDEGSWTWEEWHARSATDSYWIEYDPEADHWILYEEIDEASPLDPRTLSVGKRVTVGSSGQVCTVTEVDTAGVLASEGELTWIAKRGESLKYADASVGKQTQYSFEWDGEALEAFRGSVVDTLVVLRAFGLHTQVARLEAMDKTRRWLRVLAAVGCIVSFLGVVWGAASGERVFARNLTLCPETYLTPTCVASSTPIGPVFLEHVGRIHRITITSRSASRTNWHGVIVRWLNERQEPVSSLQGQFYEEFWQEGGESGVERSRTQTKSFRLTVPGTYYLTFENIKYASTTSLDEIQVTVMQRLIIPYYFLIFGIMCLLAFLVLSKRYSRQFLQSFFV